jgi:hypothetical protein
MPIFINDEEYYTAKELSVKFNVTMECIRNWRKTKGLNGYLIGKRKYFYSKKYIEQFIKGGLC